MNWTFTTGVTIEGPSPLLDALLDYGEVECRVHVECELRPGHPGGPEEPPESPEARLEYAEVEEITVHPHDDPDPDASEKALLLMTTDMRKEIERAAARIVERDWHRRYEEEAFRTHHEFHMGWD